MLAAVTEPARFAIPIGEPIEDVLAISTLSPQRWAFDNAHSKSALSTVCNSAIYPRLVWGDACIILRRALIDMIPDSNG